MKILICIHSKMDEFAYLDLKNLFLKSLLAFALKWASHVHKLIARLMMHADNQEFH